MTFLRVARASSLLFGLSLFAGCDQPGAVSVDLTPTLSFPDSDGGIVPLDPPDGFPVRVRICAPQVPDAGVLSDGGVLQNPAIIGGSLQAHIWLSNQVGGGMVATGTAVTDVPNLTLEPDLGACGSGDYYSAITTLNAPGPGPVMVSANVDNEAVMQKCVVVAPALTPPDGGALDGPSATDAPLGCVGMGNAPPLIALSLPETLGIWNGAVPRYTVCAETAAIKGTVQLTSYDPGLVSTMQTPLTGTLIVGPCVDPPVTGGPGVSHVNFDLSLASPPGASTTPFTVVAVLQGMPVVENEPEDPYSWTETETIGGNVPPVSLTVADAGPVGAVPAGELFQVVVNATQILPPTSDAAPSDAGPVLGKVEGLTVAFATGSTGVTFSPASNITDANGNAVSYVVIPFGTQVTAIISGGGVVTTQVLPTQSTTTPTITLTPTFTATQTLLPTGQVYQLKVAASEGPLVDAGPTIDAGPPTNAYVPAPNPAVGLSVNFATTTTGVAFSPASVATDNNGNAVSYVTIPYGTQILAVVSAGGAVQMATQAVPAVALTAQTPTPGAALPTGQIYELSVTAQGGDAGPATDPGAVTDAGAISGLPLAFSTTTTGVAFSPAAVNTNSAGQANSYVTVPYGTQVTAVVSGGGTVIEQAIPPNDGDVPVLYLSAGFNPTKMFLPTGQVYMLTATAEQIPPPDAGAKVDAGPGTDAGVGVSLTFATTTTGVTFSPGAVSTTAGGTATSYVTIPYGTQITAVVSGGGAVTTVSATANPVLLTASWSPTTLSTTPQPYTLTVGATSTATSSIPSMPIGGLGISITFTDSEGTAAAISAPMSPILTLADGGISYNVPLLATGMIPDGGLPDAALVPNTFSITAIAVGGGAAAFATVPSALQ